MLRNKNFLKDRRMRIQVFTALDTLFLWRGYFCNGESASTRRNNFGAAFEIACLTPRGFEKLRSVTFLLWTAQIDEQTKSVM